MSGWFGVRARIGILLALRWERTAGGAIGKYYKKRTKKPPMFYLTTPRKCDIIIKLSDRSESEGTAGATEAGASGERNENEGDIGREILQKYFPKKIQKSLDKILKKWYNK